MRVLINAVSLKMGGGLTYLQGLLQALGEVAPDNVYIVCVTDETRQLLRATFESPSIRFERYPYRSTSGPRRLVFDQVKVAQLARRHQADVLYSATGFATHASPCPQLLMIHNLIYFSEQYAVVGQKEERARLTRLLRRWWTLRGIRAADTVIYPTDATRQLVESYLGAERPVSDVIHYGLSPAESPISSSDLPIIDQMREWRAEGYKVLVNVSLYSAHKNLETVVEALPQLIAAGHRLKLVLTVPPGDGPFGEDFTRFLHRLSELRLEGVVIRAGALPHAQVLKVYGSADLFLFPSFTESFGYPMVEAMRAGLPSVAADTDVNREILAESALFFATRDPSDCAAKIHQMLSDPDLMSEKARLATSRAALFRWPTYAKKFLHILEGLVDGPEARPALSRVAER